MTNLNSDVSSDAQPDNIDSLRTASSHLEQPPYPQPPIQPYIEGRQDFSQSPLSPNPIYIHPTTQQFSPQYSYMQHQQQFQPYYPPPPIIPFKDRLKGCAASSFTIMKKEPIKTKKKTTKALKSNGKNEKYTLLEWEELLELFNNGDYGRYHNPKNTHLKHNVFWESAKKLLKRSDADSVKKAFSRGPLKWVKEYNNLRGDGNTGGKSISFIDIVGCKAQDELLAEKVIKDYADAIGMSTKGGATHNDDTQTDDAEYTQVRVKKGLSAKQQQERTDQAFFDVLTGISAQNNQLIQKSAVQTTVANPLSNADLNVMVNTSIDPQIKQFAQSLLLKRLQEAMGSSEVLLESATSSTASDNHLPPTDARAYDDNKIPIQETEEMRESNKQLK